MAWSLQPLDDQMTDGGSRRPGGRRGGRRHQRKAQMDVLDKVLREELEELTEHVRAQVGLTRDEARRLVEQARPALLDSYRWRVARPAATPRFRSPPGADHLARDLLDGISGREVAEKAGIPATRGWEGLRALVPAVLDRVARSDHEGSALAERMRPSSSDASSERSLDADRLAVGFGLFVEGVPRPRADGSGRGRPFGHPIFDRLPFHGDQPS